jgi:hypothetical protein
MAWFDATQVDPATGSTALPVGTYPVVIRKSSRKGVKDNSNSGMLVLTLEIIDGPHKGQSGDYRLNLWNENKQAAEIAGRQLSALCHVIGIYQLNATGEGQDCAELFGKPFVVVVDVQAANEKYTEVKQVLDMQGRGPIRQAAPPVQQQPPAGGPSWGAQGGQAQPQQQYPAQQAAPADQPSWGGGQPTQQQPPGGGANAPSWAQQPASDKPSWAR